MKPKYVVKKILYALLILFVVVTLNFLLPRLIFDDPAEPFLRGIPEDDVVLRERIRAEYGLDGSVFKQYCVYLFKTLTFDYGYSHQYKKPVFEVMFSKIPWSMILSVTAMIVSVALGIIIGTKAAQKRGGKTEKALLGAATATVALPSFWIALVFVMLFGVALGWFPYRGAMTEGYELRLRGAAFLAVLLSSAVLAVALYIWKKKRIFLFIIPVSGLLLAVLAGVPFADLIDVARHAFLPVLVICVGSIIGYGIMVRNSMLSVADEDYITTAKAKGLSERQILYGHTLRNALLPMVTSIGMSLAGIFGGSVLIERIFSWPGMGGLLVEANSAGDYPLAQGILFFYSFITIFANLLTDFVYHKLDPRIKAA
jgi:peptide/nickel transport system permease protein